MSNKDKIIQLLDDIPDYKMGYVLAYVQGIAADEETDDLFCEKMVNDYINDPDPDKDKAISIEELAKELGVKLCWSIQ